MSTKAPTIDSEIAVPEAPEYVGVSWKTRILFFLLLSGPPKFRLRDPSASLESLVDWVIVLQVAVWILAGWWVWSNREYLRGGPEEEEEPHFSSLEKLCIAFFVLLSFSVLFSAAPAFSAFKVYQLVITFSFVTIFAKRYGVDDLFNNLFYGCGILAVADIVAAFVRPELVYVESELGSMRFRGDLVAQTGIVSLIGLFLLLTLKSDLPKPKFFAWLLILGGVLVASLMRTSYLAFLFVLVLAALRRPAIPVLRKLAIFAMTSIPLVWSMALSALDSKRQVEDIWTLSDRVGLWSYLIDAVWTGGRWLGLGYFAASRVYAPEYNPGLGTAHSAFMEVFVGGGMVSLCLFLCIWTVVGWKIWKLYLTRPGPIGFAFVALFFATLFIHATGGELQSEPSGFSFWCIVAGLSCAWQDPPTEITAEA